MFDKAKARITEPIRNVAMIAWAAFTIALLSLFMAIGSLGRKAA